MVLDAHSPAKVDGEPEISEEPAECSAPPADLRSEPSGVWATGSKVPLGAGAALCNGHEALIPQQDGVRSCPSFGVKRFCGIRFRSGTLSNRVRSRLHASCRSTLGVRGRARVLIRCPGHLCRVDVHGRPIQVGDVSAQPVMDAVGDGSQAPDHRIRVLILAYREDTVADAAGLGLIAGRRNPGSETRI